MSATVHLQENVDESLVCAHRDLSVCPDCFDATPGLIEVYGQVYRFDPEVWKAPTDSIDGVDVRLSPGTAR